MNLRDRTSSLLELIERDAVSNQVGLKWLTKIVLDLIDSQGNTLQMSGPQPQAHPDPMPGSMPDARP